MTRDKKLISEMKQLTNHLFHKYLLVALSFVSIWRTAATVHLNPGFSGRHLVVSGISSTAGFNMIRNSTGHIVKVDGMAALMLAWLSQNYNFTYSVLQVNDTALDPSGNHKGLISYLLKGDCDVLISLAPTYFRVSLLEFSHPALYVPVSYLIPKPNLAINVVAVIRPFQPVVWFAIIISVGSMYVALYLLRQNTIFGFEHMENGVTSRPLEHISFYILGTLLGQGGYIPSKSLSLYLAGGVWCIAAFVLVNAYNSILIAYVTLPSPQPLIKSIYDLRNRPDIHLVTDRNLNTEAVLSSADSGFLKVLGDKLRAYPNSRCNVSRECVRLVKSGSHVYTSGLFYSLYGAMRDEYRMTGHCRMQLGTESYTNLLISWALRKGSKSIEYLNLGIMQLNEAGLISEWNKKFQPNAKPCLIKQKKGTAKALKLNHLTGAFILLATGTLMSFIAFFGERMLSSPLKIG